ncbi:MAG: (R)-hydratase [Deltaproteobacteria bacterium]|nr:(R)-hydratase [Deltaproteobacteria bacterium]
MHEPQLPDNPDFEALLESSRKTIEFRIEKPDMDAFARLSGDFNPLHTKDEFARTQGFSGRVVYGGLLVAQISRMIGMHLPGKNAIWSKLDVQFISPLFVDEEASLTAEIMTKSEAAQTLILKIRIERADKLIARGNAMVQYRSGNSPQAT